MIRTILLGELPGVPVNKTSSTTAVNRWRVMERSHEIPGSIIEDYLIIAKYKSDWILQILFRYIVLSLSSTPLNTQDLSSTCCIFLNNPDRFVFAMPYSDHRETQGLSL